MQTTGTLTTFVGVIAAVFAWGFHTGPDPGADQDWIGTLFTAAAIILVPLGIILSITGRAKSGGPI